MVDPGFPRGGDANLNGVAANRLFWPTFPKNCMKMKNSDPEGGGVTCPWGPMLYLHQMLVNVNLDIKGYKRITFQGYKL